MLTPLLEKLIRQEDLTADEAASAMAEVMEGRATSAELGGLLVGLAMKGERPEEIVGFARAMRAHAVPLSGHYERVFETELHPAPHPRHVVFDPLWGRY